jgi:hypothetical protein
MSRRSCHYMMRERWAQPVAIATDTERRSPKSGKLIVTSYVKPPIPTFRFDWCAYFDGEEEEQFCGYGETEQAAINELLQMEEDER